MNVTLFDQDCSGYYAAAGYEEELARELADDVLLRKGRLFITRREQKPARWAQNVWYDLKSARIESIKDAARILKSVQRNWAGHKVEFRAREGLIEENLPHVSARPLVFMQELPGAPMGGFTLIEKNLLLYSARCSSLFPRGEVNFQEDKTTPPGRAYLKLWELLTLRGQSPGPGDVVIDLGGSPGGWTWVLSELGCEKIISVDKATLDPAIAGRANVEYHKGDAFTFAPLARVDWVFSDVICEPERLYTLVQKWLAAGKTKFVCTLKFKGASSPDIIRKFAEIPDSRIEHLYHNKHELTWTRGL